MKCKDCDSCKFNGEFKYICLGTKEPFMIENINNECTEYPKFTITKVYTYDEIQKAIDHLKVQIEMDLKELDGDTTSEFAQILLRGHKHINVAINVLEEKLTNIMLKYTE